MRIIGHRGASGYEPENTLPAFRLAGSLGADGVELDVRWTGDRKAVVLHGDEVEKVSDGRGRASQMTLGELKRLNFAFKDPSFQGREPLPELWEALDACRDMELIDIEIKTDVPEGDDLPAYVAELVRRMGISRRVVVSCFSLPAVLLAKKENPELRIGFLWKHPGSFRKTAETCFFCGVDLLCPSAQLVTERMVAFSTGLGLAVYPWTVDCPKRALRLAEMGCQGIITNYPDIIRDSVPAVLDRNR